VLNEMLDQIGTPKVVAETDYAGIRQQINDYYDKIVTCIKSAAKISISYSYRKHCSKDLVVAGWNDIVEDKHAIDWVAVGKPRNGPSCLCLEQEKLLSWLYDTAEIMRICCVPRPVLKIWQIRTLNLFGAVLINIKMPVLQIL